MQSCLTALRIQSGDVVCIVGAGGKTSLMYLLAQEARQAGLRVLVTTSTRLNMPHQEQYDRIDTSGGLFAQTDISAAGIYVGVRAGAEGGKVAAVDMDHLCRQQGRFDLMLIEADGAAGKSLKGWKKTEPVVPGWTSKTIGLVDIQTVGRRISDELVHRLEIFLQLTSAQPGDRICISHLCRLISHPEGLFRTAQGARVLCINKVESGNDLHNANELRRNLGSLDCMGALEVVAGSVQQGLWHG